MSKSKIVRDIKSMLKKASAESGSALLLSIVVMVLLTALGIALLTMSEAEVRMSQADTRTKSVFFVAEAGVEHGRETLRLTNPVSTDPTSLDDELDQFANGNAIELDPDALAPVYDANGDVTGFTGYGDDLPLATSTDFAGNRYAAFLSNDPGEGITNKTDTDRRVMITSIGTGPGRSVEKVQAIVTIPNVPVPPTAILLLGDGPDFKGGTSAAKHMSGDDCVDLGGGIPGLSVPVVGVIGSASEVLADAGVNAPSTYESGAETGEDTVDDIESWIDSYWTDCDTMHELALAIKDAADVVGDAATPFSDFGQIGDPKIVYIEGGYELPGNQQGAGLLWVTGTMKSKGNIRWEGVIYVVGTGSFIRSGAGTQDYVGAFVVADVAGPDGVMWTADDCSGPDGVHGTVDDDFESGSQWEVDGGGNGLTNYCTAAIFNAMRLPFHVAEFRQD